MKQKKYYITTPIYYPSGNWHLGHCYTTVACDAVARFKRKEGYDVFYLTGTDEHGQKIEKKAAEEGKTPKTYVDERVADIKRLWKLLDVSYDGFIRTTDKSHEAAVQKIFKKLYDSGDIYKSRYKGKYCTPCEAFWTETQLVDGKCPDCGREVTEAEEESYFFRLSKYADRIKKLLTETDYLSPSTRVNEMVNNFLKEGLTDLAVSRTSFKWGIPVEFDKGHVVYVWVDALSNYITALGAFSDDTEKFERYWPADLHMVGKEIVRFHAIIWPAILMALNLPLPKKVFGHGWLLMDGDKMSKSKGNIADPYFLAERYGVDSLRYFLLREIPFGSDGQYTDEALLTRINADLVNDLGNLNKRTQAMCRQYFGGKVTAGGKTEAGDGEFTAAIDGLYKKVCAAIDSLTLNKALEEIFAVVSIANKYIDLNKPWVLFKDPESKDRLNTVLYNLAEALRVCATMLTPFLTKLPDKIFEGLGLKTPKDFESAKYGAVKSYDITELDPLMKRLDVKAELKEIEQAHMAESKTETKNGSTEKEKKMETEKKETGLITVDEFFNTQLRIAEVIACEKVEKTEKLLKLTVKIGEEERTVVSGIAKAYTPEEMVGKKVVLVYNLKPAKLRGIESQGMILCATKDGLPVIVSPEGDVDPGSEVC